MSCVCVSMQPTVHVVSDAHERESERTNLVVDAEEASKTQPIRQ